MVSPAEGKISITELRVLIAENFFRQKINNFLYMLAGTKNALTDLIVIR